ncbi:nitrous oxide reductase family maturation protein NosD [Pontibacter sp. BT310]|uniref:Nitrous oxide reductase family maturation protein NosD n=1 Tax=Pontibacter populi TaxID=890055 RepID=A0ABS6XAZ5_9BACT|nr:MULTISPECIES: nitrous oxide reductase family maturation protein NosD [Pontibacter]MBJ6118319.1 nitrous oxide reductase family maturation protein NosD [Pontibacter sp. BT310]MBR0570746.1 nitrous oxide reductase family maturation protein NosD [Microvirga sp. STS03]MBW3365172.1 nitrous oxide reductase family maturation protein NosD [Pontibacter populi]
MKNPNKQIFLLAHILALLLMGHTAFSATLKVCKTCTYTSVKQAVQKAKPGDTVLIDGGTYQESGIEINKPLRLIGQNNPVIDSNYKGQIITITVDDVTVDGLTLKNIATSYIRDDAAIRVFRASNVHILNNTILNTYYGIYLQNSEKITIKDNVVKGENTGKTESALGNAIHLYYTDEVEISGNNVQGHRDGIYLEVVKNSKVHRNSSLNNQRYGLHFMFSNGNTYTNNIFRHNGAGVAVMYTDDVLMEHNTFEDNWGAAAYGLLLKDIRDSVIRNNIFKRNTTAIYMESSSRLDIKNNDFERNGWAIKLMTTCVDDTFRLNNFTGNSFDVSTNGTSQLNHFENNYWEKYTGYDLDKNGVGDVPYRPVSLYAMLVERVPPSVMLMRSFMVDLLDNMEKVLPSIIPENLVDEKPLMKRIKHDNDKELAQVLRQTTSAAGRER